MAPISEIESYRKFTGPAEMQKSVNGLIGLITGIAADGVIDHDEYAELVNWYELHRHLIDRHPYNEVLPAIDAALEDGKLELDEAEDLIWLCHQLSDEGYYNFITSSIQQLHGILHGIIANNVITTAELEGLQAWQINHADLRGTYPFDEIHSLLVSVTADGVFTDNERDLLKAFFSEFVDLRESVSIHEPEMAALRDTYSISGICASNPHVIMLDHTFCFTGTSARCTRDEMQSELLGEADYLQTLYLQRPIT